MTVIDKIIYGAFAALVIVAVLYYAVLANRIQRLAADNAALKTQIADCERWARDADAAIIRQNAAAIAAKIDTVYLVEKINIIAKNYAEVREVIEKKVEKDSSSANRLQIIDNALRCWHNGGVYAEDGNAR